MKSSQGLWPNSDNDFTGAITGRCTVAVDWRLIAGEWYWNYETFGGNEASGNGGGMYFEGGAAFDIRNHGLFRNVAGQHGGGLYNAGSGRVINGVVWQNEATAGDGGGFYNGGNLYLYHNTYNGNSALLGSGGAIYNDDADFRLNSSLIYANSAGTTASMATMRARLGPTRR